MKKSDILNWQNEAKIGSDLWDKESRDSVGGLHLRKNAKSFVWRLVKRNEIGKRCFYKLGDYPTITLTEARKLAQKLLVKLAHGDDPRDLKRKALELQSLTVQKYLDDVYIDVLKNKKSGDETAKIFPRHFSSIMKKPMAELCAKDILVWQSQKIEDGLVYDTQKRNYGALKTLFNDAVKRGYLSTSPISGVSLDKVHDSEEALLKRKLRRTALDKKQISDFMAALDEYERIKRAQRRRSRLHGKSYLENLDECHFVNHVKPFLLFMFYTGFRNGDVYGLRWEHLTFKSSGSTIHKTLEKTEHKNHEPKTFPIPKKLEAVLLKWKEQCGYPENGYVFPGEDGKRMGKKGINKQWMRVKKLAGIPEETDLYSLRHTFGSWLVSSGVDLLTVAKLMGHSDVKMIIAHYGHLQPNLMHSAVESTFDELV